MRFLNKTFTDIKKNWNIYTEEENNQDGTVYKHKYYIWVAKLQRAHFDESVCE